MSQQNIDIVRTAFGLIYGPMSEPTPAGASIRGDSEEAARLFDPDVEVHGTIGGLWEGRVARGLSQALDSFDAEDREVWEERRLEPQRYLSIDDLVVVLMHEYRRGRDSGIEVEADTAVVFKVRGGRVIRVEPYMHQAAALEAAGLTK